MNIPFPRISPRLVDPRWFNADNPCDEEAELTALEQANQQWNSLLEICSLLRDELIEMLDYKKKRIATRKLNSVGQQYMKRAPFGKTNPEPMEEEADTDEEDGNDESDESEESHDEDEEEELRTSYSPSRNNNELEPDSMDDQDTPDLNSSDQSAMWPLQ